ncbi:hypothetical protein HSX10_16330 [Winogradskyella undariae]|uniref:hypothetical protein n=1 Tax=Winogradskyella undariae TaxID=1285465 RepID=UPI00156AC48A|nr:hypothetical protein [Winogradskyella undariae]NRR93145.1 hypothetical protein [Winogradskyella undariae]
MKYLSIFAILLLLSCNERNNHIDFNDFNFSKDNTYLIFRGTNTKQGYFAKQFNIKDSLSTHVGILQFKDSEWLIYNVSDFKDNFSDFKTQNLNEFLTCRDGKVLYLSVWTIKGNDLKETRLITSVLKEYKKNKIEFDRYFSLNDSTKLYCSEFVNIVLKSVDSTKFNFKPIKRELKGVYKTYFKKDTLNYYPVDIFEFSPHIIKKKEWYFEE